MEVNFRLLRKCHFCDDADHYRTCNCVYAEPDHDLYPAWTFLSDLQDPERSGVRYDLPEGEGSGTHSDGAFVPRIIGWIVVACYSACV